MASSPMRAPGGSGAFRRLEARPLGQGRRRPTGKGVTNLLLLLAEVAAVIGVVWVLVGVVGRWRAEAQPVAYTATPAASVAAATIGGATMLPGEHQAPGTGSVPQHLQGLFDPLPALAIPTAAPGRPSRIVIARIDVDTPVVEGDDDEALKMGVGHHIGSANPGERGNMVLSGHNDVYGEVFRYLDRLGPGDSVVVYSGTESFEYTVRDTRIVEPNDVSVLEATQSPALTLVSCYPYLIDTHRIVVVAELAD
ncbi:MAG: sortase [Anaerolineae bacterium]